MDDFWIMGDFYIMGDFWIMSEFWIIGESWIMGDFWFMGDFWMRGGGADTQRDKQPDTHTHQYQDSAWPKGRAEWKP